MIKKGIILAGGTGSRMSPITKAVNKQLLPLYDKPLFYYPLSVLMLAKIKDILIIVNKGQIEQFKRVLPNGNNLGVKITYLEQEKPKGLPDAFIVGEKFIGNSSVALILGDNFFFGQNLTKKLIACTSLSRGAKVFLHPVKNPSLYGVATINQKKKIINIV
jgi:glucose-1-phosphate thymidylyltransferase